MWSALHGPQSVTKEAALVADIRISGRTCHTDRTLPFRADARAIANRPSTRLSRSPLETEKRLIYELGNGQWDIPALRNLLEDIIPRSSVFNDFVLEHDFPAIGRRIMLLNARRLHAELVLLAMEDVTERRRTQSLLAQLETYAQDVVDTRVFRALAQTADECGEFL